MDFFVCLLYGRLLVAIAALIQRCWAVAIVLVVLAFWPYERATKSTDDWAAATRALLNFRSSQRRNRHIVCGSFVACCSRPLRSTL